MNEWIKVHETTGELIRLQVKNIVLYHKSQTGKTIIKLIGDKDHIILARETPEEVDALIAGKVLRRR